MNILDILPVLNSHIFDLSETQSNLTGTTVTKKYNKNSVNSQENWKQCFIKTFGENNVKEASENQAFDIRLLDLYIDIKEVGRNGSFKHNNTPIAKYCDSNLVYYAYTYKYNKKDKSQIINMLISGGWLGRNEQDSKKIQEKTKTEKEKYVKLLQSNYINDDVEVVYCYSRDAYDIKSNILLQRISLEFDIDLQQIPTTICIMENGNYNINTTIKKPSKTYNNYFLYHLKEHEHVSVKSKSKSKSKSTKRLCSKSKLCPRCNNIKQPYYRCCKQNELNKIIGEIL
jgi:hypothetical protein